MILPLQVETVVYIIARKKHQQLRKSMLLGRPAGNGLMTDDWKALRYATW